MKLKRILSAILIYLLVLNVLPMNLVNAYAETTEETYSLGYCNFHQLYKDCAIAVNGQSIYVLKNGVKTQYALDGYFENYIDRIDNYVFFLTSKAQDSEKYTYQIEKINILNGAKTVAESGINLEPYTWIADAKLDTSGNGWLSIGYHGNYSLLKIDNEGSVKNVMSNNEGSYSIFLDNQNNIWADYAYNDSNTQKESTKVFKLLNDTLEGSYSLDGKMSLYNISDNGNMWFNSDEKITCTDSKVNTIASYDIGYSIKDVQADCNGNTWILKRDVQSGTSDILKLENGAGVTKQHLDNSCFELRVIDDNRMSAAAYDGNITIFNDTYGLLTVKSTSPLENSKNVLRNSDIRITYNENIMPGENYGLISLFRDQNYELIPCDADTKFEGDTVTIKPSEILQGGKKYYVYLPEGAVTNETEDKISEEYGFAFTTQLNIDKTAPKVNSSVPKSGSKDVRTDLRALFVNFSEDIAEGVNFDKIQLKLNDKDNTLVDCEKQVAADTLIVKLPDGLQYGMGYSLYIPKDSITDLSGNQMSKDCSLSFTTYAKPSVKKINIKDTNVKLDTKIQVDFNQNIFISNDAFEKITINSINDKINISNITTKGKSVYIQLSRTLAPNTEYTLTIPNDVIIAENYDNSCMAENYTHIFTTENKDYPLKVTSTTPNKSEKDVKAEDYIVVNFNKKIVQKNFDSITLNNLKAKNADDKKINYISEQGCSISDENPNTLIIKPEGLTENTTYTLTIPGDAVTDLNGAAMKGNFTLNYTTAASNPVLTVKSSTPKNNATSVKLYDPIKITFNKKVELKDDWFNGAKTGLEMSYLDATGQNVPISNDDLYVYVSGNTLYIYNLYNCNYDTKYTIKLNKDFLLDMTGKPMENDYTLNYTSVKDKDAPVLDPLLAALAPYYYSYDITPSNGDLGLLFNEALSSYDLKCIKIQSHKNEKIEISDDDISKEYLKEGILWIKLSDKLKDNTRYTVTIKPGAVKDMAGNKSKSTYVITGITSKDGAQVGGALMQSAKGDSSADTSTVNQNASEILKQFKAAHSNPTLEDINNLILQLSGCEE